MFQIIIKLFLLPNQSVSIIFIYFPCMFSVWQVSSQLYQQYLTSLGTNNLILTNEENVDAGRLISLEEVTLEDACDGSLVLRSFSFGRDAGTVSEKELGIEVQCIPASIIADTSEDFDVPLTVSIRNRQYGTCMHWQTCATDDALLCITGVAPCGGGTNQLFWKVVTDANTPFVLGNREVTTGEKFKLYPSGDQTDADSAILFYYAGSFGFDDTNNNADKNYAYGQETGDSIDSKFMADGLTDDGTASALRLVSFSQTSEFDVTTTQCAHDSTCFGSGPWTPEAFQWDFLEIPGLMDVQIDCGQGKAIQSLTKLPRRFTGACVEIAGLASSGGCFEKVSLEGSLFNLEEMRFLGLDCGAQAAMQALNFEVNALSQNLRMKARCCPLVALPVALVPTTEFSENEDAFEGKYCSTGLDDSGRPKFEQVLNFINVDAEVTGKLEYNRAAGKWCLESTESSESSCVEQDVVHPLDLGSDKEFQGTSKSLYVLPMLDFNSQFVGVGAVGLTTPVPGITKWTSPPALLRFAADDPQYRPECKDEYHPGSDSEDAPFDRDAMNAESRSLWQEGEDAREDRRSNRQENPCAWIWSADPNTAGDDAPVGLGWRPKTGLFSQGKFTGIYEGDSDGVTYRTVKECADREVSRIQEQGALNFRVGLVNELQNGAFKFALDLLQWKIDMAENSKVLSFSKFGALTLRFTLQTLNNFASTALGVAQVSTNRGYGKSDTNDCLTLQHGLARVFCDLHCIRDAVKAGDKAILSNLEKATEVINNNTNRLLEFYLSEDQGAGSGGLLLKSQKVIVEGMSKSFAEMRQMLQTHLHPMAASAITRSINTFLASTAVEPKSDITHSHSSRNVSNFSFQLGHLASKVTNLHSTLSHTLSSHKVSASQSVSDRTGEYVTTMMQVVKAKAHTLGIHKNAALKSKERQHWLRSHSATSVKELLLEMQDEFHEDTMKLAMDSIDKTWWMLRSKLDMYFDVMEEYWGAFKSALVALNEYTDRLQVWGVFCFCMFFLRT